MTGVHIRFGAVDVSDDGFVVLHVTVSVLGIEHKTGVRFTEERAHRLVAQFHEAVSKLKRTRLGA